MDIKEYIYTEGKDIRLIGHDYLDDENTFPKPSIISHTVGYGKEIFDKYEIPKELQKVFFVVNKFGMKFMKKHPQRGNLDTKKYHRFKGMEILTGTEFYFAYNVRGGDLFGYPSVTYNFDTLKCCESNRGDFFNFIQELRKRRIYDSYIKAIAEISNYRALSGFDKIEEEQKELIKK